MDFIARNIEQIRRNIAEAAAVSGRSYQDVTLVAVTKSVEAAAINQAIAQGVTDIGENRVQEARRKFPQVEPVRRHMIGHLQTNKADLALDLFELIHSVDSLRLGRVLSRSAVKKDKVVEVLVQVNISGEKTKYGVKPEEALALVSSLSDLDHIKVAGLMTICPYVDDPEQVRPFFRQMRLLKEKIESQGFPMEYLSMGMSGDYAVAVEEGSNMVRIGTAVFQKRCENGA
ncbi:MAG: YggS family pyridoxal phosphate-dependent enzyme [Limnochordia bacterium]|nr:YggS family pyridoxal phosphate-dependent enzyme [Limnochordia bacterium]MDD2630160.1 YggS family pyridoxal phosphate-dependent enzyme [Limnochordia bacterium]MDD4518913.1 YggS family pyridoxal phosphate-dependent enzyme [Limnochordia bacterium]